MQLLLLFAKKLEKLLPPEDVVMNQFFENLQAVGT